MELHEIMLLALLVVVFLIGASWAARELDDVVEWLGDGGLEPAPIPLRDQRRR